MRRTPTEQEIGARAHVLWEQSSEPRGDPRDKWEQAKAELEAAEAAAESADVLPPTPDEAVQPQPGTAKKTPVD
jgi:hypothetical protein